ncbi:DUF72 domain-containing protein [Coprothermobacteraceae bacterium]|nr:DUF72 domain-containing protein [Coprothermobacteraceae bacterium]
MLPFYARYFNSVEINSTFYHMPRRDTVRRWLHGLPDGFTFSVKGYRGVTHFSRLEGVAETLEEFYQGIGALSSHLAVVLWQLPPSLKVDVKLLESFLAASRRYPGRVAMEFRHKSWVCDEVFDLLRRNDVAFVVSHGDNYPLVLEATADFVYIRLHGYPELYRSSYSRSELVCWSQRILDWAGKGLDVFVYFNNDMYGYAVENARALQVLLEGVG